MATPRFLKEKFKTGSKNTLQRQNIAATFAPFLAKGQSSKASLLKSMILMQYLFSSDSFPKKDEYISIVMQSIGKKILPTSERKENRKKAINEMAQLVEEMLKHVPENKQSEFLKLLSVLSEWIDRKVSDGKNIKKLNSTTINEFFTSVISHISNYSNQDFLTIKNTYLSTYFDTGSSQSNFTENSKSKSPSHLISPPMNSRSPKIFGNLFKNPDQLGKEIGKSNEGVSSAKEVEYHKKKGGVSTFFKKIPTLYSDVDPFYPPVMRSFFEVILGNIYNLYVDVPKSRILDLNGTHVLSQKKNNAISLSNVPSSCTLPLANLFGSILISLALKEGDLKKANMVTDFKMCYRIDFFYSLQGKGDKYNLDNLQLLNPVYLLECLYGSKYFIPSDLLQDTLLNFDNCVMEIVHALQNFIQCSEEKSLLDKSKLAMKLAYFGKLSPKELDLIGIASPLPKDLRLLTDKQREMLESLTVDKLVQIDALSNTDGHKVLTNHIIYLRDMEKMFDVILAGIKDSKKNAEKLWSMWLELGPTDKDRLNNLHKKQFPYNHNLRY